MAKRTAHLFFLITFVSTTGCFYFTDQIHVTASLPSGEDYTEYGGSNSRVVEVELNQPLLIQVTRSVTCGSTLPHEFDINNFQFHAEPTDAVKFELESSTIRFSKVGDVKIWVTAELGPTEHHPSQTGADIELESPPMSIHVSDDNEARPQGIEP